ncbi:MAG: UDP-2,3-diacylglucosamine diphosphatase LpxI [Acidaminococcaceae bacterium]|nr:UDP-2,3-diacylglucosamine diphosphatase LpxI [Acidaminococcaceae bacterium]
METLGLLAGIGHLPVDVAQSAKKLGYKVVAIAVVADTDPELPENADVFYTINVGKVGKILQTLKQHDVKNVTMIGKVTKEVLYKNGVMIPDLTTIRVLASLPDRKDDTIMNAIVKLIEDTGMHVMDQTVLIQPLLPEPGVLTKRKPTEQEWEDMRFGFRMAKELGRLDIGQTVVVKNRAVMALEAIEGTDACILRGGFLGKGGVVVAKTAKPAQDNRFDMPSVGTTTLTSMIHAGATGIVIEAGRTLLVDRKRTLAMAEEKGITIVSMSESELV